MTPLVVPQKALSHIEHLEFSLATCERDLRAIRLFIKTPSASNGRSVPKEYRKDLAAALRFLDKRINALSSEIAALNPERPIPHAANVVSFLPSKKVHQGDTP